MSNVISFSDFISAINNAHGTLSAIFPTYTFCFSSDAFTCYRDDSNISIVDDTFKRFPLPCLSIDCNAIKQIEQMTCNDGSTEYEVTLDSGTITLDINTTEDKSHAKHKTA